MTKQCGTDVLKKRQEKLLRTIAQSAPSIETVLIFGKINQYYLTGTVQDGLLVLRYGEKARFFVRKSYERACHECMLEEIIKIRSYRDLAPYLPRDLGVVGLESEQTTLATMERLKKYFKMQSFEAIDSFLFDLRAIKEPEELKMIEVSGSQHARLLNEVVPEILREGMSETDFFAEVYENMIKLGHHGVSRFAMPQMELILGQLGFGENALYPTNFNGPGGMKGMSPAVPIIGDRLRLLKKGDLVFLDVGYGFNGYHSDKTQVYCFGDAVPRQAKIVHEACRSILKRIVEQLKPGAVPASIYRSIMSDIPPVLKDHFMGFSDDPVRFLGHGVGLQIDESPVIADRITTPLSENMVIAVEPKCGVPGIGMVGVEETYVITSNGARCLTGGDRDIRIV